MLPRGSASPSSDDAAEARAGVGPHIGRQGASHAGYREHGNPHGASTESPMRMSDLTATAKRKGQTSLRKASGVCPQPKATHWRTGAIISVSLTYHDDRDICSCQVG